MSRTDSDRTREAASSMASGSPSSDAAHLLDGRGGVVVEHELAPHLPAPGG